MIHPQTETVWLPLTSHFVFPHSGLSRYRRFNSTTSNSQRNAYQPVSSKDRVLAGLVKPCTANDIMSSLKQYREISKDESAHRINVQLLTSAASQFMGCNNIDADIVNSVSRP